MTWPEQSPRCDFGPLHLAKMSKLTATELLSTEYIANMDGAERSRSSFGIFRDYRKLQ